MRGQKFDFWNGEGVMDGKYAQQYITVKSVDQKPNNTNTVHGNYVFGGAVLFVCFVIAWFLGKPSKKL